MLVALNLRNIKFMFNLKEISYIQKTEDLSNNMVIVMKDGTRRVISNTEYDAICNIASLENAIYEI